MIPALHSLAFFQEHAFGSFPLFPNLSCTNVKKKTTTVEDIVNEHHQQHSKKKNKNDIWDDEDVDEEYIEEDPRTEPE